MEIKSGDKPADESCVAAVPRTVVWGYWELVPSALHGVVWPLYPILSCGVTESMCLWHSMARCGRRAPHCRVGLLRVCASGMLLICVAAVPRTVVWGY